ncbi:hypothetical protein ACFVKB_29310 [Rhodococcus sp. NPDC127530]
MILPPRFQEHWLDPRSPTRSWSRR